MTWRKPAVAVGLIALVALLVALLAPRQAHDMDVAESPLQAPARPVLTHVKAGHLSLDGRFLAELGKHDAQQLDAATGKGLAVGNAHTACLDLAQGEPWPDVAQEVLNAVAGYDEVKADYFVELAIQTYCPQEWR